MLFYGSFSCKNKSLGNWPHPRLIYHFRRPCSDVYGLSVWFQVFSVINCAFLYCAAIKSKIYDKQVLVNVVASLWLTAHPSPLTRSLKKSKDRADEWC